MVVIRYTAVQNHMSLILYSSGEGRMDHVLLNRENTYIPDNSQNTWDSIRYINKEVAKLSEFHVVLVLHTS